MPTFGELEKGYKKLLEKLGLVGILVVILVFTALAIVGGFLGAYGAQIQASFNQLIGHTSPMPKAKIAFIESLTNMAYTNGSTYIKNESLGVFNYGNVNATDLQFYINTTSPDALLIVRTDTRGDVVFHYPNGNTLVSSVKVVTQNIAPDDIGKINLTLVYSGNAQPIFVPKPITNVTYCDVITSIGYYGVVSLTPQEAKNTNYTVINATNPETRAFPAVPIYHSGTVMWNICGDYYINSSVLIYNYCNTTLQIPTAGVFLPVNQYRAEYCS